MPIDVANPGGALSPFSRGNAISPWFEMSILTPASSAKAPIYSCCWIFSSRTNPDKRKYRSFVSNALTCTTWYELTKTTNFEELELKNPSSRTQNLLSCYEMDSKTKPSAFPSLSAISYKAGKLFSDKWPLITYHFLEQYKLEWARIPVQVFSCMPVPILDLVFLCRVTWSLRVCEVSSPSISATLQICIDREGLGQFLRETRQDLRIWVLPT